MTKMTSDENHGTQTQTLKTTLEELKLSTYIFTRTGPGEESRKRR